MAVRKQLKFVVPAIGLGLALVLSAFQNCSPNIRHGGSDVQANGNATPYEGKIYASQQTCVRDGITRPTARIKVLSATSALLVDEACVPVNPPTPLTDVDFQLDSSDPNHLTYASRDFYFEQNVQNKIAFGSSNLTYVTTANSITSNPLPAPVANGDLVVCAVNYNSPNAVAQLTTASDNLGNTYRRAAGPFSGARETNSSGYTAEVWYAENIQGGNGLQFTANFSEAMAGNHVVQCNAYSGIESVGALDQVSMVHSMNLTTSMTLPPLNTNANNELLYFVNFGGTDNPAGLTVRNVGGDGSGDRFVTQAGPYSADFPLTSGGAIAFGLTFRSKQ